MSVIAKMQLNGVLHFGSGAVSKLSCVCENDLMAAYAKSDEDRLFTKYSPWGEIKIGHSFSKFSTGHKFYVVVVREEQRPPFAGATHVHPMHCYCVHDFGSSKQVELSYSNRFSGAHVGSDPQPGELEWRMTIDNPPAVAFFEPGKGGYYVAFYDAEKFDMQAALADAHKLPEEEVHPGATE